METPLDVLSRAASLVHADDEKRKSKTELGASLLVLAKFRCYAVGLGSAQFKFKNNSSL